MGLRSITTNIASGGEGMTVELFQILKDVEEVTYIIYGETDHQPRLGA